MLRRRLTALLAGTCALGAATAAVLAATGSAQAAAAPLPAHVFAPYFESWTGDDPAALSQQSGAKFLTMAFLQTTSVGSCTVVWNGDSGMPVSSATFGSAIASIRAAGGDVVPSFGGFTADTNGTELSDSCTSVASIAKEFERVITTYNVTRIDLDVEVDSLNRTAGIDRRNKAIKMVEDWAATNGRTVQFVYTLPTTTSGLADTGLTVLQNAKANNARIDVVNIMTFDYFDNAGNHQMANDTKTAATGLHGQIVNVFGVSSSTAWHMVGVTEMVGIDDFGAAETFTVADANAVESWAVGQQIAELSFWALQRDNGSCPGTGGSDSCSGISQGTWQFSHIFEPFTSGTVPPTGTPTPKPSRTPTPTPSRSPTPTPSGSPPGGGGPVNGGFETGTLAPWTCSGSTGSVVSAPVHSGTKALQAAATTSDNATCSQTVTLQANHTYTLSAWVQGSYAFIGATTAAGDTSTFTPNASGYTRLSVTFSTTTSTSVRIWVHGWYGTGTVFVDDVSVS